MAKTGETEGPVQFSDVMQGKVGDFLTVVWDRKQNSWKKMGYF